MKMFRFILAAAVAALAFSPGAFAQSTVTSQAPLTLNATGLGELLTQSQSVTGGTLYTTILKAPGVQGPPVGVASTFVSSTSTSSSHVLAMVGARATSGVALTAAAGTPAGAVGISRTAGTSYQLVGEATSSSAKTNTAMFELVLPASYVAAANIPVVINCAATGGTITSGSTTMTVTAYQVSAAGVETALTVSAAQQIPATATNLTFTITGTPLVAGSRIVVSLSMLVTTSAGAGTGVINSVSYTG